MCFLTVALFCRLRYCIVALFVVGGRHLSADTGSARGLFLIAVTEQRAL